MSELLGKEVRKLGFGLMRLPKEGNVFDLEQIKKMVDRFLEEGFTYFDTAWVYSGSEDTIRQALVERYPRESFQLATKLASWAGDKTLDSSKAQFAESLRRTGAGYFDFYLLHNLGGKRTELFDNLGIWDYVADLKAQGLIKHYGFSFHAQADALDKILDAHPEAEFVQLQINYADWEDTTVQSRACYEVARKHNKPVIIMEPVKGGLLAAPPPEVVEIFRKAEPESTPASWALRFAASLPGVMMVLSGMSSIEQMEDNLATMKNFHGFDDAQKAVILQAQETLASLPIIPCTSCRYCAKVCPKDIGIAGTFEALNMFNLYKNSKNALQKLSWTVDAQGHKRADECIQCGKCEQVCPQHLPIRKHLQEAAKAFPRKG